MNSPAAVANPAGFADTPAVAPRDQRRLAVDTEALPVAVIGAGMCGLACAQELKRLGLDAVVFDKARAPGGRMTTRRRDDFEWDMGAQMMLATSREFVGQLREWQFRGLARRWRGRFSGPDIGVRGAGPFYVGLPRMGQLARAMARGLDLRYPVRVQTLASEISAQGRSYWSVYDQAGLPLGQYRAVLSTLPRAQSATLFEPYAEVRNALAVGGDLVPTWSVYIVFRERLDVGFDAKTFAEGPINALFRNNAKPERADEPECWVLHADPQLSAQFLDYPRENVASDMLAAMEDVVGQPLAPLVEARAHRWLYALPTGQSNFRSQYDNRLRLGFGGDWVQPPANQFGGVEAAYLSGRALAQQAKTLLP